jgi:hypothetical protein
MDNTNQIPSYEIPKSPEQEPLYKGAAEKDPGLRIEANREILPAPVTGVPTGPLQQPSIPLSVPVVAPSATATGQVVVQDDSHIVAEDTDVIEKEWVDRAKKIISLTSNDPYVEAKEISKLKATYMKKRFNRDLPLAEEKKP